MNTVWVYGDSFADNKERRNDRAGVNDIVGHWSDQVAKQLGYKLENFGYCGTGLSYTFYNVINCIKQIQDNDVIVVCLTDKNRRWFFYDRPYASTRLHEYNFNVSTDEIRAYKQYTIHLCKNPNVMGIHLYNFMMMLELLILKKNIKVVTLQCFGAEQEITEYIREDLVNVHFPHGSLGDISFAEYSSDTTVHSKDPRVSHMCKSNHTILANKIVNYVQNNQPIELTGFKQNFITNKFITKVDTHFDELFNLDLKDFK